MDVRYMDILIEGERIPEDDDDFFHSELKLNDPQSSHFRSSSFKNRPRPKLSLDVHVAQRPRTNSLPNAYLPLPDPFYMPDTGRLQRVRSFKTTSKGLINHGDSFKKSNTSLISAGSAGSINDGGNKSPRRSSYISDDSGPDEVYEHTTDTNVNFYRVLMMGSPGVGKTALTRQFMTSEYKGTYAESNTPDIIEPDCNVSVLLDGEESTLHFLDDEEQDFLAEDIPIDAYVVVFAVTSCASYNEAVNSIRTLREEQKTSKAIILVGNKIDLARQRRIAKHDASRLAKKYDCRYIETSAALNHHVDELLVGILSQIRTQVSSSASGSLAPPSDAKLRSRSKSPAKAITDFFSKIFLPSDKKAKSCETLFVQ